MLPPFLSSKAGLVESDTFLQSLLDPGSSTLATERVVCRASGCFSGITLRTPMLWNLLVQPDKKKFHKGLDSLYIYIWKL